MPRGAAALNLAKAWFLAAVLAIVFGSLGWAIGGSTTALLFVFCALLAAMGFYRYGDAALLGMLGPRVNRQYAGSQQLDRTGRSAGRGRTRWHASSTPRRCCSPRSR